MLYPKTDIISNETSTMYFTDVDCFMFHLETCWDNNRQFASASLTHIIARLRFNETITSCRQFDSW